MRGGRPRTAVGTYGEISTRRAPGRTKTRYVSETRFRDLDGRLRKVTATASSPTAAAAELRQRLLQRSGPGNDGVLSQASSFGDLADLWLSDLKTRDVAISTKESYRDTLRLHVRPGLEFFTLGEITTGRVETFLKSQQAVSYSRARQSRTILNLLFGYALRHDAIPRNPMDGVSQLRRPKDSPRALTFEQIAAIRAAAATWRTQPVAPGPKPDGQVRDIIEVLLGTGMRIGEALALRPCDIEDGREGMVAHVRGTVVQRKGSGAIRQGRPKTHASIRRIAVPDFAAVVLRRRLARVPGADERTLFANRNGGPLSPYNVRRTFREFLQIAQLAEEGISLRWYRRTAATVIARGAGTDAAAAFLGHTSKAVTEGHYIEPDRTVDRAPASHLERTLRAVAPDRTLLAVGNNSEEDIAVDAIDAADASDLS